MHPYVLLALERAPSVFERLMRLIGEEGWDARRHEDRFTPREVVEHLADWEPIFRSRVNQILASPGLKIEVFDESERATTLAYESWKVEESLLRFRAERETTMVLLKGLTEADLARPFVHPDFPDRAFTVERHVTMLVAHEAYHVEQLIEYLV
ncbi:MAG: DinB family protein [Fimbriimonadaceae bacterium]|nr:DinB family protein [Fimbriimonadaceae bacterium]